ncbi:MAG: nickel pincer cofactor biosynthesis protein LarB [Treponemataceae bacterium]|nr:nickel pincer cofactor biosynthesis protein LarB [Spirochaetales bacterium]MDY6030688.1 nickel pincer cofactor biosynthesis protein LarB [Treponemataceae bacterium]
MEQKGFKDIGLAKIDTERKNRTGVGEVIFGQGKTQEQINKIVRAMKERSQDSILITRLDKEKAGNLDKLLKPDISMHYFSDAKIGVIGEFTNKTDSESEKAKILICCAGTSDLPVAEEAAITLEFLGNKVERLYDVGVAGIHRLLSYQDKLKNASVVIAIAGMEGALASVIGGLVSCPVIAVPTSVGYGASFGGLAALLSMLNSCASGVTVVNIDNGFGAAMAANKIMRLTDR